MDETRLRAHDLGEMGEKGDDVVLDFALDRLNARDIKSRGLTFFPDRLGGVLRDHPELRHGIGGMRLDLEPDAKSGLGRPDRRHQWTRVARNRHAASPRTRAAALRIAAILARSDSAIAPLNTAEPATKT